MSFREKASRIRKGNAPAIMAALRHLRVNLLDREPPTPRQSEKRRKAAWNHDYRLKVLFAVRLMRAHPGTSMASIAGLGRRGYAWYPRPSQPTPSVPRTAHLLLALLLMPLSGWTADPRLDPDRGARGYVGSAVCGECHAAELGVWRDSYHDRAMAPATPDNVLGDFADATVTAHGVTSRFFRRDGQYLVNTDGPDGQLRDYPIAYTFGWWPLQQYLIEFPGGRLQALGLAWDSRAREQGGQRWFHLYPDADGAGTMDHRHPLHWTGREQTWNYQCADCHSTDLRKGYDAGQGSYATRYAEINVGCEACHGPGASHVEQARAAAADPSAPRPVAPPVDLNDRDGGVWSLDPATGKPVRSLPRTADRVRVQTETCARCHARRGRIWETSEPGAPLHQGYRLALLEPDLYFPDGQIKDEVFVFGSFIQSRMYHQGVVCTDCHEPHGLGLSTPGNAVCTRCHGGGHDSPTHHHHAPAGPGSGCVDCHMPQRRYMVIDERADHSLRIPRPDLSVALGTPNACNGCHQDRDAAWAADAIAGWFPDPVNRPAHFATALAAGDAGAADAPALLLALAADPRQPALARASALRRLDQSPGETGLLTIRRLLADPNALVRAQAVRTLGQSDLPTRAELAWPLLDDPARTVRLEAALVLAPLGGQGLGGALAKQLEGGLRELVNAERVNADRPEAHLNLGLLAVASGDAASAEGAWREALALDRAFTPARVNLADLYRALGRESAATAELEQGLALARTDAERADLHHARGLAAVRAGRMDAALNHLASAARLAPTQTHYAWVYAVALDSAGRTPEAIAVLEAAQGQAPRNRDLLIGLVQYQAKQGDQAAARHWLDRLRAAAPADPALPQLEGAVGAQ